MSWHSLQVVGVEITWNWSVVSGSKTTVAKGAGLIVVGRSAAVAAQALRSRNASRSAFAWLRNVDACSFITCCFGREEERRQKGIQVAVTQHIKSRHNQQDSSRSDEFEILFGCSSLQGSGYLYHKDFLLHIFPTENWWKREKMFFLFFFLGGQKRIFSF
jgi:hypothetical protein